MRQYGNSPTIQRLIRYFEQWIDSERVREDFYNKIWNIETATGYGLDVWGRIVGVDRELEIADMAKYFGYYVAESQRQPWTPFKRGVFYNGQHVTKLYRLSDISYRKLILFKAMKNISESTVPNLNALIQFMFEGKRCYVLDMGNMTIRYVFEFELEEFERAILFRDMLPRPAGVLVEILEIPESKNLGIFGFDKDWGNFDNSVFTDADINDQSISGVFGFDGGWGNFDNAVFLSDNYMKELNNGST